LGENKQGAKKEKAIYDGSWLPGTYDYRDNLMVAK
jgi:hypothetical protein